MANYQKKRVIIEAFKVGQDQTPEWFKQAIAIGRVDPLPAGGNYMEILAPGRPLRAYRNDYVVLGDDGDIFVIKPKLFEATYEPVALNEAEKCLAEISFYLKSMDDVEVGRMSAIQVLDAFNESLEQEALDAEAN